MCMGISETMGYLILGPSYKDPTIQGTALASLISGNPHIIQVPFWGDKNTVRKHWRHGSKEASRSGPPKCPLIVGPQ